MTILEMGSLFFVILPHCVFIMVFSPYSLGTVTLSSPYPFVMAPSCHVLEHAPRLLVTADWAGGGWAPHLKLGEWALFPSDILQTWEMSFGMDPGSILSGWTREMEDTVVQKEGRMRWRQVQREAGGRAVEMCS